ATARFDVTDGFVLFEGEARYAGDCSEVAVPSISGPTVEIRCDENGVLTITTPERRSHDGGTPWEVLGISPSPDRDVIYRAFARSAAQAYGSDTTALDTLWQAYIRAFELRLEIPPPRAPRYLR